MSYQNARKYFMTAKQATTVKQLLADNLPAGATAEEIVSSGAVWLDKKRVAQADLVLAAGQTLRVYTCSTQGKRYLLPAERVVFENKDFLLANKPAMLSIGADRSNTTWNLTYGVQQYLARKKEAYQTNPINRLDFAVQGLVLYAKNKRTEKELFVKSMQRKIGKIYQAIIEPMPNPPKFLRIKDKINFLNKAYADEEQGKEAHSLFIYQKTIEQGHVYSVLIFTGRRHQIRYHASRYLAPIVGDSFYGAKSVLKPEEGIRLAACGYNFILYNQKYRLRLNNA